MGLYLMIQPFLMLFWQHYSSVFYQSCFVFELHLRDAFEEDGHEAGKSRFWLIHWHMRVLKGVLKQQDHPWIPLALNRKSA